jgi:hypothetical protein
VRQRIVPCTRHVEVEQHGSASGRLERREQRGYGIGLDEARPRLQASHCSLERLAEQRVIVGHYDLPGHGSRAYTAWTSSEARFDQRRILVKLAAGSVSLTRGLTMLANHRSQPVIRRMIATTLAIAALGARPAFCANCEGGSARSTSRRTRKLSSN